MASCGAFRVGMRFGCTPHDFFCEGLHIYDLENRPRVEHVPQAANEALCRFVDSVLWRNQSMTQTQRQKCILTYDYLSF